MKGWPLVRGRISAGEALFREPNEYVTRENLCALQDELRRLEAIAIPGSDARALTLAAVFVALLLSGALYGALRHLGLAWIDYYVPAAVAIAVSLVRIRYRFLSCEHSVPGGRTYWKCMDCRQTLLSRMEWVSDATEQARHLLLLGGVHARKRFLDGQQKSEENAARWRERRAEQAAEKERLARIESETNRQLAATQEGLCRMDPLGFEKFVADLFAAEGWEVQLTATSGDGGVDVLGVREGRRLVVQCKRYSLGRVVGSPEVQALMGAAKQASADVVVFATTSGFSRNARIAGRTLGIELIDGPELVRKLYQTGGTSFGAEAGPLCSPREAVVPLRDPDGQMSLLG